MEYSHQPNLDCCPAARWFWYVMSVRLPQNRLNNQLPIHEKIFNHPTENASIGAYISIKLECVIFTVKITDGYRLLLILLDNFTERLLIKFRIPEQRHSRCWRCCC